MREKLQALKSEFISFFRRQYFVLFLGLTTVLKLCWFEYLIGIRYDFLHMLIGYAFTFITVVIFFLPLLFLSRYKKLVTALIVFIISFGLFADIIYFRFFQTLPTFGLLDAIKQSADVMPSITSLLARSDVLLFLDLILALGFEILLARRYGGRFFGSKKERQRYVFETIILWGVLAGMMILVVAFSFVPKYKNKLAKSLAWSFETRVNAQYFGVLGGHLLDGYRFVEEKFVNISPEEKKEVLTWAAANQLPAHQD